MAPFLVYLAAVAVWCQPAKNVQVCRKDIIACIDHLPTNASDGYKMLCFVQEPM